jgi:hypothetical protein
MVDLNWSSHAYVDEHKSHFGLFDGIMKTSSFCIALQRIKKILQISA